MLDLWVAHTRGLTVIKDAGANVTDPHERYLVAAPGQEHRAIPCPRYSTEWSAAGPIIGEFHMTLMAGSRRRWRAQITNWADDVPPIQVLDDLDRPSWAAESACMAAMRTYLVFFHGQTLPDVDLLQGVELWEAPR